MMALVPILATFLGALVTASGFYMAIDQNLAATVQIAQWVHLVCGWVALAPIGLALYHHWKLRGNEWSGLVSGALLLILALSGVVLTFCVLGGLPLMPWLSALHLWTAVVSVALIAVHLGVALRQRSGARWQQRVAAPAVVFLVLLIGAGAGAGAFVEAPALCAAPPFAAHGPRRLEALLRHAYAG